MNISRRDFIAGAGSACAIGAVATGCMTVPTAETARMGGVAVGSATGIVLDQCEVENEVRSRIIELVGLCRGVAPQDGETVWDAWTRTAGVRVDDLVASGKITKLQGDLILVAFSLVVKGLQILVFRHPEVGIYGEIAIAAIGGFCDAFLEVYRPDDASGAVDCQGCLPVDAAALRELRTSFELDDLRVKSMRVRTMRPPRRQRSVR